MLHWILADGLDSETRHLTPDGIFSDSQQEPFWITNHQATLRFNSPWDLSTNAMHCLMSGQAEAPWGQLFQSTLQKIASRQIPLSSRENVHVFGVLGDAPNKGGFNELIQLLKSLLDTTSAELHIHLILPPPKEQSQLLPLDCLYQLESWIQAQETGKERIVLASFAGSTDAFYGTETYLKKLIGQLPAPRFTTMRTSLHHLLEQGFSDFLVPTTLSQNAKPLTSDSLLFPVTSFEPFLSALGSFTDLSQLVISPSTQQTPPPLLRQICEDGPVSILDLSPNQAFLTYLQTRSPALPNLRIQKDLSSQWSEQAALKLTYDDRIHRAVLTGIKKKVVSALENFAQFLDETAGTKRSSHQLLSGVASTSHDLFSWKLHSIPPRIPFWIRKATQERKINPVPCTLSDFAATLVDLVGIPLPSFVSGKSILSNL